MSTATPSRLVSADLAAEPVAADGVSLPLASAHRVLWDDGRCRLGVWEAGPGVDTDVEVDELFLVLDGAGTVHFVDLGRTVHLRPGTLVRLGRGDRTRWRIDERLRKVYLTLDDVAPPPGERLLSADVTTLSLAGASSAGQWVDSGWPSAAVAALADLGSAVVSTWEMTPGAVVDIENDELLVVVAGAGLVEFESGAAAVLRPGAALALRGGDRARWAVDRTLRVVQLTRAGAGAPDVR